MTRKELEIKAKEFDSKLKRHPMSSEELQKVLCDFVEALRQPPVSVQVCGCSTPKFYQVSYHYRKCEHCGKREYPQTLNEALVEALQRSEQLIAFCQYCETRQIQPKRFKWDEVIKDFESL